jgi:hypothetical protein
VPCTIGSGRAGASPADRSGLSAISADVRGYAVPDPGAPHVHEIRGFALFSTGVPEYVAYNTAVVEIHGTVDMATGELVMTGRAVTPDVDHAGLRATARPNPARPGTCRPVGARTAALRARSAADARRT